MRSIKIGTRNSPLALWQAREVARNLQNRNYKNGNHAHCFNG